MENVSANRDSADCLVLRESVEANDTLCGLELVFSIEFKGFDFLQECLDIGLFLFLDLP